MSETSSSGSSTAPTSDTSSSMTASSTLPSSSSFDDASASSLGSDARVSLKSRTKEIQVALHGPDALPPPKTNKEKLGRVAKEAIPMLTWLPEYNVSSFLGDLVSGLTVGVMLVPQGMAYALLAGLPPQYGLYSALFPLLIYPFFGSSRQLAVGPVALVSLLVASSVSSVVPEGDPHYIELATTMAFLAGILQALMGVFRLGFFVNFLAHPVISGFTTAAAIIIGFSQVKLLLGVSVARHEWFVETVYYTLKEIPNTLASSIITGLISIAILVGIKYLKKVPKWKSWTRFIPGALVIVVLATVAGYLIDKHSDIQQKLLGDIPEGLPTPKFSSFSRNEFVVLLPNIFIISIVGFLESISVAKVYATQYEYEVNPSVELWALGVANLFGSFFGSYPVTGGFSRTAVNASAGSKTPLSSLLAALIVLATLLFLTPVLFYLPRAVLGALIIVAVAGLIKYEEAIYLWRVKRSDFALYAFAVLATLGLGVELGILVAVGASLLYVIQRTSTPHYAVLGRRPNGTYRNIRRYDDAQVDSNVVILRFDAALYFANVKYFRDTCERVAKLFPAMTHLILDASAINNVDTSAVHEIETMHKVWSREQREIVFAAVKGPVRDVLAKAGVTGHMGKDRFYATLDDAVYACGYGLVGAGSGGSSSGSGGSVSSSV